MKLNKKTAYFSMEIALDDAIPNYYGGLGILAGDILLSASDMQRPIVGVSLIYHRHHDPKKAFHPEKHLKKLDKTVTVMIEDREVKVLIYKLEVKGKMGYKLPVYFLSTNCEENTPGDRAITQYLYASDPYLRLAQEIILGVGGVQALQKVEPESEFHYHMNEGHSAFLTLEVLRREHYNEETVRDLCTFTSHTPVAAGHDYFEYDLVYKIAGDLIPLNIKQLSTPDRLGLSQLAMNLSTCSNSVSAKHQTVCDAMFPGEKFRNVTNGIYHLRWVGNSFAKLYDRTLPEWKSNPEVFKKASKVLSNDVLLKTKLQEKKKLIDWINTHSEYFPFESPGKDDLFDEKTLTVVFARRTVSYKRTDLIFQDIEKLRELGYKKLQLVFASSWDQFGVFGKNMRSKIDLYANKLRGQIKIVVIPQYTIECSRRLVSGSDVWLNNPIPPMEASGTSGMKASLNGGINLSILDGWWIEGMNMNPQAGWGFGETSEFLQPQKRDEADAIELYRALHEVIDCYYKQPEYWLARMKASIELVSFFNTHRVVEEYEKNIWEIE